MSIHVDMSIVSTRRCLPVASFRFEILKKFSSGSIDFGCIRCIRQSTDHPEFFSFGTNLIYFSRSSGGLATVPLTSSRTVKTVAIVIHY